MEKKSNVRIAELHHFKQYMMKKIKSILLVILTLALLDIGLLNGNMLMNQAIASCNIKVKRGLIRISVFRCDSTPNETCSAEGNDAEGNEYSFTCDGSETYRHSEFGGAGDPIDPIWCTNE